MSLASFWNEFKSELKKVWNMAEGDTQTINTTGEQPAAQPGTVVPAPTPAYTVVTTASSPAPSIATDATIVPQPVPEATVAPQPAPAPVTAPTTPLHTIAEGFETAISDIESFLKSKESYIVAYIESKAAEVKAAAEADFAKVLAEKHALAASLEADLDKAKTWASTKWAELKNLF